MDAVVLGVLAIVVVLLFRAQQRIRIQPVWLAVCGALLLAYLKLPLHGVTAVTQIRVMPFLFFFILPVFRFPRIPAIVLSCRSDRGIRVAALKAYLAGTT